MGNNNRIAAVRVLTVGQKLWNLMPKFLRGCRVEDLELGLASLGLDPEEAEL
jgi:Ni,Fe-hydrogenase III large subunit